MNTISERLISYINFLNRNTHKQGSQKWLECRKNSIGCSEIYKATRTGKTREKFIHDKIVGTDYSNIIAVIWGNVFESSTKLVTELILNTKIFNINGSIAHPNGVVTCSPDGLGIVRIPKPLIKKLMRQDINGKYSVRRGSYAFDSKQIMQPAILVDGIIPSKNNWKPTSMTSENYQNEIELVALYEFKSRHSRELNHNYIQPEYLFQVLGGIDVIRASTIGVYSESWFSTRSPLRDENISINDEHRELESSIYFGACKYIRLNNTITVTMQELDLDDLKGKKIIKDYEIIDGPYFFKYGNKVIFSENGIRETFDIDEPHPTTVNELNTYFRNFNAKLDKLPNKPNYYAVYQLDKMSIRYISALKGFISLLEPLCKEVLEQVKSGTR